MAKRPRKRHLGRIVYEPLPRLPSLLIPVAARVFEELEISVSLRLEDKAWHAIHLTPNVATAEGTYGVQTKRWAYNERCFQRVAAERKIVLGQHAGFCDLYAPVKRADTSVTVVAGPFLQARSSSKDVLERWRALTRTQGRLSDPGFIQYLSVTLSTLTLEGSLLEDFKRFLTCFSQLLEPDPDGGHLAEEITPLIDALREARYAERMWRAALSMVDARDSHSWLSRGRLKQLLSLGVERLPQHVVVGLLVSANDSTEHVEDIVRRDAFQRACVAFAKKRGGVVCARLGDHGVALLSDDLAKGARQRAKLLDLSRRVLAIARRFGLRLHAGISAPEDSLGLSARYQAALSAAERALYTGVSFEYAERGAVRPENPMSLLRRRLVQAAREHPDQILPLFARFVEAAAVHSSYVLEPTRAHLEACFEQVTDALQAMGTLDERTSKDLRIKLDQDAAEAGSIRELAAAYQPVVADLARGLQRPIAAGQDRAMRRALSFVNEHLNEPLPLSKVARIAGYAPRYFAKLFVRDERMTLQDYVTKLRLAHSQQLLANTLLTVEQVQQLSGFRTRVHFHRAFKQAFGTTPTGFRNSGKSAAE